MVNPNHWHLYSTETHRESDISSLLWLISFVDSWLISGDYLNILTGELKQVPATPFKSIVTSNEILISCFHLPIFFFDTDSRSEDIWRVQRHPSVTFSSSSLAINRLIQCCWLRALIRASINIWRTRSNFRHIFTWGHEIFWMYRSGQFGVSVIMLSTETPYTVQTYLQTFREPCEIQSSS